MGRKRSVSIYAQTKEEYLDLIKEDESVKNLEQDEIKDEEDELNSIESNYLALKINKSQTENEMPNFVENKTVEVEEKELFDQLQNLNDLYKSKQSKKVEKTKKENVLNILCSYFKENIKDGENNSNLIIYSSQKTKSKRLYRAMSNNAIYDIDMKEALDAIIKEKQKENEEEDQSENLKNSLGHQRSSIFSNHSSNSTHFSREVLMQNVECEEEVMKVMLIGSTHIGKTKLINNFIENRRNTYIPSSGLEIKKKIVKILNKKVRIEFFDTDANFHLKDASKIYYKLCDAFFYVVDCSKIDSLMFIQNVHYKIFDSATSNSFILITLNNSSNHTNSKEINDILNSLTNEYKITLFNLNNIDEFLMKSESVNHLFSSMLIKRMNKKSKSKFVRNPNRFFTQVAKETIESHFGFNNEYQIENYHEEEEEDSELKPIIRPVININVKRRWSYL